MSKTKEYTITSDKFLTRQERSKILKVARERAELDQLKGRITWPIRYMLVDLALFSGLRVAEIAALKIGDIHLDTKDPHIFVRNGKGGKSRDVYIDTPLAQHLKTFIKEKKTVYRQPAGSDDPLFTGQKGHVPTVTLQKSAKRAIEEAGLPSHYSIHSFRHTFATFLLSGSGSLRHVKNQLGHSNIAMTSVYAGILPEDNSRLANMMDRGGI